MLKTPLGMPATDVRSVLDAIRNDFSVAIATPGNAFAVGAIIRVAHNFLAREVFVMGDEAWYAKASMGMEKYELIHRVTDASALLMATRGRPLWAVEKDEARQSITSVAAFPPGVVFAFGSERFGLPRAILDAADEVVGIPIYGVNQSLPVAVAAGIVMHEWARRHYADGATL